MWVVCRDWVAWTEVRLTIETSSSVPFLWNLCGVWHLSQATTTGHCPETHCSSQWALTTAKAWRGIDSPAGGRPPLPCLGHGCRGPSLAVPSLLPFSPQHRSNFTARALPFIWECMCEVFCFYLIRIRVRGQRPVSRAERIPAEMCRKGFRVSTFL